MIIYPIIFQKNNEFIWDLILDVLISHSLTSYDELVKWYTSVIMNGLKPCQDKFGLFLTPQKSENIFLNIFVQNIWQKIFSDFWGVRNIPSLSWQGFNPVIITDVYHFTSSSYDVKLWEIITSRIKSQINSLFFLEYY